MLRHGVQDELSEVFIWKCSEVREELKTGDVQQEWESGIQEKSKALRIEGDRVSFFFNALKAVLLITIDCCF